MIKKALAKIYENMNARKISPKPMRNAKPAEISPNMLVIKGSGAAKAASAKITRRINTIPKPMMSEITNGSFAKASSSIDEDILNKDEKNNANRRKEKPITPVVFAKMRFINPAQSIFILHAR
jgi:hypothetical protein